MSYIGFGLGNGQDLYLPIPKNASSAHRAMFRDARWQPVNFQNHTGLPCYVPWRHPVERWYSGAAQYARKWELDLEQLKWEVYRGDRNLVLDKHTIPQSEYVLSTIGDPFFVPLDRATEFCKNRWDLTLPVVNRRLEIDFPLLDEYITRHYQTDLEVYESIS